MDVTQSNLKSSPEPAAPATPESLATDSMSEQQDDVHAQSAGQGGNRDGKPAPAVPTVSVVLPAYNEQQTVDKTFAAVLDFVTHHSEYEFIFVDDGSTDDTAAILDKQIADSECKQVRLITLETNRGKGGAMKRGFEEARGKLIIFTDGDLAYSLDHLPQMVDKLDQFDMVIGSRQLNHPTPPDHPDQTDQHSNRRSLARMVLGEGFNSLARFIMGLPYRDTQAGLKGFRREAAQMIFPRTRVMRYCTDVELLFLAHKMGLTVGEMPARVDSSHAEKPTSMNLLGDPPRMFLDMMRIRWNSLRGRYD